MMKRFTLSGLLLLLSMGSLVHAEANDTVKMFKVELLAFDQRNDERLHEEHWPIAPGTPDFNHSVILHDLINPETDSLAYSYLPTDKFELTSYEHKLDNSGQYHTLLHVAWLQPMTTEREAKKIHLTSSAPFEGNITLSQSRYPHASLDFVLYHDNQVYRLSNSTKLKLNKMQYIDNPLVGILIKVSKVT